MGSPKMMPKITSKIGTKTTTQTAPAATVPTSPINPKLVVDTLRDWNVVRFPKPDKEADGEIRVQGAVWYVGLNNDQTHRLQEVLTAGGGTLSAVPGFQVIGAALLAAVPWIEAVNDFGGDNGVDINGAIGTLGVIVTPRVGKIYAEIINDARLAVSGRTVLDFLVRAASVSPALSAALNISVVGTVFKLVASGTPLGWALSGALGWFIQLLQPEPDVNDHGAIMADRRDPFAWESFTIGQLACLIHHS